VGCELESLTFPDVSKELISLSEGQLGQDTIFLLLLTLDNDGIRYFVNLIYIHLTAMSLFQHHRALKTDTLLFLNLFTVLI